MKRSSRNIILLERLIDLEKYFFFVDARVYVDEEETLTREKR